MCTVRVSKAYNFIVLSLAQQEEVALALPREAHLVYGLESAGLVQSGHPLIPPQLLHILQHELDPGWDLAFLDDV